MRATLYTIHTRRGRDDRLPPEAGSSGIVCVGERHHPLGAIPPLWAAWRGLWVTVAVELAVLLAALWWVPAMASTLYLGLLALTYYESDSIERAELRLRGWEEVGATIARSEEGAEQDYLEGRAVPTPAAEPARAGAGAQAWRFLIDRITVLIRVPASAKLSSGRSSQRPRYERGASVSLSSHSRKAS